MKMSKYRVSIFCTFCCKPSCMEAKRNKYYFDAFSPSIRWDNYSRKKRAFFKIISKVLPKLTKSVRNYQHPILWRNHQNWNLFFRNFLLKYKPCINDKELHEKEQKAYTNFFYFYVLNFHLTFFHKILTKGNS